ncbi:MAG: DMT family transporter [Candidatus Shapirobacteria bacterium]
MAKLNKTQVRGTSFILISALFFGTYGIWSRLMVGSFGAFSQAWTRGLVLLIVILILNFFFKFFKPIAKKDYVWFIVIGMMGLNQAPYYFGFKYLNIGTATMIFYSALLMGGYILGKFIFGEKITKIKYLSLGLAILGIAIIYRFVINPSQFLAAGLTIVAGLMGAVGAILPKKLSQNYSELQIMTSYFIPMFLGNFIFALFINDPLPSLDFSIGWIAQFAYILTLLFANLAVIEGFKHLDPSIGSLIGLAEILFGILFGVIFFGEVITFGMIIGGLLIIISAVLPNIKINNFLKIK